MLIVSRSFSVSQVRGRSFIMQASVAKGYFTHTSITHDRIQIIFFSFLDCKTFWALNVSGLIDVVKDVWLTILRNAILNTSKKYKQSDVHCTATRSACVGLPEQVLNQFIAR
mmetsp:Transcript_28326/g.51933  ORF Transcript_28326/g.51933 Transcript_28326/m.51933 type:complete len:112 (-) Transcript_28326:369-704(-)